MQRSQDYISQTAPRRPVPAPCRRPRRRREHPCHFSRSIPERGSRARPVSGSRAGRPRLYAAVSLSFPGDGRARGPGSGRGGAALPLEREGGQRWAPRRPRLPNLPRRPLLHPPVRPAGSDRSPGLTSSPVRLTRPGREAGPQVAAAGGRPLPARPRFGAGARDRGPGDSQRLRPEGAPAPAVVGQVRGRAGRGPGPPWAVPGRGGGVRCDVGDPSPWPRSASTARPPARAGRGGVSGVRGESPWRARGAVDVRGREAVGRGGTTSFSDTLKVKLVLCAYILREV